MVDPNISIITNENMAGTSLDTRNNSQINHFMPIPDIESFERLMSPLSLAAGQPGGFGAMQQAIPRPQTQFQDTDRSGMNISAFSDFH